jgi:hypothetical protein
MKALAKNPDNRYQTAYEMGDDLRRFRNGVPVWARRYRFHEKVARALRHEKRAFAMATIATLIMFAGIVYAVTTLHRVSRASLVQELRGKVMGIAATAAMMVDPVAVERVRSLADKETPECRKLVQLLKEIKARNERVEYVWIMRKSAQRPGYSEFVVEDDTLNSFEEMDKDHDGVLGDDEERVEPGMLFAESLDYPELAVGYTRPTADQDPGMEMADFKSPDHDMTCSTNHKSHSVSPGNMHGKLIRIASVWKLDIQASAGEVVEIPSRHPKIPCGIIGRPTRWIEPSINEILEIGSGIVGIVVIGINFFSFPCNINRPITRVERGENRVIDTDVP